MSEDPDDRLALPDGAIPSLERLKRMATAAELAIRVLSSAGAELSVSPLGPGWSSDIDVHVTDLKKAGVLAIDAGWIPLGGVLRHLGHADEGSYAIVENDTILARADLKPGRASTALDKTVGRVCRIGFPDVRVVLEMRHLIDGGVDPGGIDSEMLAGIADLEYNLGGSRLATWRSPSIDHLEMNANRQPPRVRRPIIRMAISGIDGSGKSTLTSTMVESLERCCIPVTVVWTRPGMRLNRLDRVAGWIRRLRNEEDIGLRRLAEGQSVESISSRQGITGWIWLTLVTVAYLTDVRKRSRKARGVVIYDRYLIDALGTVEALYQGVRSGFHLRLIRWFLHSADFTILLDIDPAVAAARKPDDLIGATLVALQHAAYREHAHHVSNLLRYEATHDSYLSATEVLRELCERLETRRLPMRAWLFMSLRKWRA